MAVVLWAFALFALTASGVSGLVFGAAQLASPFARRVTPRARAWLWLLGATLPSWLGGLVTLAVLGPQGWFGGSDHCLHHTHHLHLCMVHGAPWPPLFVVVFTALFAARAIGLLVQRTVDTARAERALRRLRAAGGLATTAPSAFTAGWLVPEVFASRPIREDRRWNAVLAHEHDHAHHRDPLARLFARLMLAFHLPVIAERIDRALVAAQEQAADEAAARVVGDRAEVAAQLVSFARSLRAPAPASAAAALDPSELEVRVRALLSHEDRVTVPAGRIGIGLLALTAAAAAALAPHVHHMIETLLGALGA